MFWYWETVDWTTTTVTRTLDTGTVRVTQRHCSDLKLGTQIFTYIGNIKLDTGHLDEGWRRPDPALCWWADPPPLTVVYSGLNTPREEVRGATVTVTTIYHHIILPTLTLHTVTSQADIIAIFIICHKLSISYQQDEQWRLENIPLKTISLF